MLFSLLFSVSVLASKARAQANDGADQTVREESEVALNGSNSFDPDDGIASYRWKQVAGASVTFSDPTEDRPTFEAPSFDDSGDQPLIFELIVTDSAIHSVRFSQTSIVLIYRQEPISLPGMTAWEYWCDGA